MAFGSFWGWTPLGSKQGVKTACCCFRIGSEKFCRRNLHSERESVRCSWQRILRRFWQMLWRTGDWRVFVAAQQFGDGMLHNSFCKHQKHLLNPLTSIDHKCCFASWSCPFLSEFWDTSRFQTDNLTRPRLEDVRNTLLASRKNWLCTFIWQFFVRTDRDIDSTPSVDEHFFLAFTSTWTTMSKSWCEKAWY